MKTTKHKSTKSADTARKTFTDEERAAMGEYVKELGGAGLGEMAVLAKIAEMPAGDQVMAKRLHALIKKNAPGLAPKTWYGMPAYATKEGKVVCFFQTGAKFKYRYSTLGFQDAAKLDEGSMWPTSYALKKLTPADEAKIVALIKKAVG